jgi:DivIVA domain-containing protein
MGDERRITISPKSSRLHPDDVARRTFATSRRGFDPAEVRAYLESLAREFETAVEREQQLLGALAEAEHRAANPVLDEATLTTALGQETAKVLRSAHDAAAELLARAEADGARVRTEAQDESEQLRMRAEQHAAERASQADAAAADMRRRTQDETDARVESAKLEAEGLLSQARAECRAMVQEAQELRARVLADLTRRRRVLHTQIEQLRAGRERLAETINEVRHTVEEVTDGLFRAEDEARLAAEAAGRQVKVPEDIDELLSHTAATMGAEGEEPSAEGESFLGAEAGADRAFEEEPGGVTVAELGVTAPAATENGATGQVAENGAMGEKDRRQSADDIFARLRAESVEPASAAVAVVDEAEAAADSSPTPSTDPALARRDELLGPAASALTRRLKRVMADDQNDILDRLRARRRWDADVLPSEEDHERRYLEAVRPHLVEAGRAGALFAGGSPDAVPPVEDLAADLARAIVAPLRRRLLDQPAPEDDTDDASIEHVGSAFREWKGQRVERVALDHAHAAFSLGELAVTPENEPLRWVVDDDGVPCPDCDDNALAGPLPRGESFPTGQLHPPAHPGCRCLLVPGPA